MAEAIFNEQISLKQLSSKITCDSAGTAGYHIGDLPDYRTLQTLKKYGIPVNHYGRQLQKEDFQKFDYILTMDGSNLENTNRLKYSTSQVKAFTGLLLDFSPEITSKIVPDPYYGNIHDFENVYQLLWNGNENFLNFLIKTHNL